jgi:hypothetical protein
MMRGHRQDMAGYSDLLRRDAQLLQEHSQSVKALRVAQLNRPDPVLVTAEAHRKLGHGRMYVGAIWADKVKHARCFAELTHGRGALSTPPPPRRNNRSSARTPLRVQGNQSEGLISMGPPNEKGKDEEQLVAFAHAM